MVTEYIKRDDALEFEAEIEVDTQEELQAVMKGIALYAEHIKKLPCIAIDDTERDDI